MMKIEALSIPNGHLFKLKSAYERMFLPQRGEKPRMPASMALRLVECIELLGQANERFLKAVTHLTADAESREAVQATLRDLSSEEVEVEVVVFCLTDLEKYDVYVDPEAVIIMRGNGVLIEEEPEEAPKEETTH